MLTQIVDFISFLYIESFKAEPEFKQTAKAGKQREDVLPSLPVWSSELPGYWQSERKDGNGPAKENIWVEHHQMHI